MLAWYGFAARPGPSSLCPPSSLLAILAALGVGAVALRAQREYRDFRYMIPFLTQFWLFLSPVGLSQRAGAGALAPGLQPQPDGRRDRRLPLVPSWRPEPAAIAGLLLSLVVVVLFLWLGSSISGAWNSSFADVI